MNRARSVVILAILAATGTFVLKGARWHTLTARWADQGLMTQARRGACSVLLPDGRVLISGGSDARGPLTSAELFDGSGSFSETAPMYAARAGQVCAALPDGRVLVAGGTSSGNVVIGSSEIYDPANDSWSLASPMMEPRSGATASRLLDDKILVAGGDTGTGISAALEVFDPALGSFSAIPGALSSPRRNHAAAVLKDGRVLIAGGNNGSVALDSADVYDPAVGSITQTPKMSSPRDGLSATRLLDGTVLFAGGNNGSADLASAELFNPKNSAFSAAAPMQSPRRDHLAFLLPDNNTVLIVGGTSAGAPLATSEQFIPWQNTFKSSDSLSTPRTAITGTPLKIRGVMMVAGGKTPKALADANVTTMGFATVTTDKPDYQPGDTVTITGAGFGPNEVVAISIVEDPDLDADSPIQFNVTTDANGGFADSHFAINTADLGVTFTLTATGQTSGLTVQMTFTDNKNLTITFAGTGAGTVAASDTTDSTNNKTCTGSPNPCIVQLGNNDVGTLTATASSGSTFVGWSLQSGGVTGCSGNTCNFSMGNSAQGVTATFTGPPTLASISPNSGTYGGSSFTLTATGSNFINGTSVINFNGTPLTTSCSGATTCSATVPAVFIKTNVGNLPVTVSNETSTTSSVNFTLGKRPITVTAATNTKTYDATTAAAAAVPTITSGSIAAGDSANFTEAYTAKGAGTGLTLTPSGTVVDGNSGNNYTVTFVNNTTGVIAAKALTTSGLTASNKVYDGNTSATLSGAAALQAAEPAGTGTASDGEPYTGDAVSIAGTPAGTFASKNVVNGIAVNITGLSLTGAQAGNYTLTALNSSANITPKVLTGSITASNKIYDGTTAATIATRTLAGVIAPDVVTLTGGTATFDTKNAGTGKTVTATGLTPGGADAGNYTVNSTATTTADIAKLALTVTAATNTKTYDGTTTAAATPTITTGAVQTGDTANFSETYDTKNVGTGKTLTSAGTVADGNSGNNYSYAFVTNTAGVINKAALTITAATNTKTYDGTTSAAATPVPTGLQTGDTVTGATETYDTRNFGTGKTVSVATYTVNDGNGGGNYTVTPVTNNTGVINKATLTITAVTNTKIYDATTIAAAIPTASGVQPGDTVTGVAETYDTATAGSGKTLSVSGYTVNDGNNGANYTVNPVSNNTGVISQAAPGVTENGPGNSTYGQSITVSVTVTPPSGGAPMGSVQFTFVQNSITNYLCSDGHVDTMPCGVNVMFSGGVYTATVTTSQLPPGMDGITATYSGDTNFTGGVANNVSVTVSQADTATTVTKSIDPSTYGDAVTLTVKVKNNTPDSTGVPTGIVGLSFKLDLLDPNTYYICSDGSTSTAPCAMAQSINLTPDVSDPTHTATATVNTSLLPAGLQAHAFAYTINGSYSGDTNFKPSGPVGLSQTVNQRAITVTAAAETKPYDGNTTSAAVPTITSGSLTNGDTAHFTQTFNNRNAGSGKTLTPAGSVNDGFGGNNYAVTFIPVSAGVITARTITVTAVTDTKIYDGTVSSSGTPTIAPVLISPDSSGFTQAFSSKNVGTGKTLIPSGLVNDGNGGNNYVVSFVNNTSGVINAASLTITAATNTKTYDATTTAAATPTYSGLQTGDSVTGLAEIYDNKNAGNGKTLSVSTYTVNDGNGGNNYTVTKVDDHTGVINAAPLTISAATNTKTYDSTTSAAAIPAVSGVKGSDTVTNLTETYDTRHAGTGKTLSVATYTVNDGNSGSNYTVTTVVDKTGVINPAPLTITATTNTKTYDATTSAAATPTTSGLQGSDSVTGLVEVYDNKNAGSGKTLSVTAYTVNDGNGGADYTVTKVADNTGVINKAPLTIAAVTNTKIYDGNTSAAATPTVSGLQGSDTATATEAYNDKTAASNKILTVTAYTIGDGNSGSNYSVTKVPNNTGVINLRPLNITATGVNKIYDGNASATVTLSDDRVGGDVFTDSYASAAFTDKNVANGKTINVTGISIAGTDAGNYTFNTTTTASANITARTLNVTAMGISKVYDGMAVATVNLSDDRVSGDVFTDSYASATFANKNVGTGKPINVTRIAIAGTDAGNYVLASTTAMTTADITVRPITVSAVADSKVYDGATASGSVPAVTAGSIAAGDSANFSQTFDTRNVGTNKTLTAMGSVNDGNGGNNYAVTFVTNTTGVISKRPITVTAAMDTKTYDGNTSSIGTPTITTGTLAAGGDTATFTQLFDSRNAGARMLVPSGTVSDGNAGNNYAITFVNTAGTIKPRPLTITATGVSKVYDANASATVTLADNRVSGDVFNDSYAGASFTDKNIGIGKTINVAGITISGTDAANYTFNYTATATADITAKGITGSITAASKVYDRTTAATITGRSVAGVIGGDMVSYVGGTATFSDKTVATGKTVTATGLGLSGGDAGNYTVNSTATTTADITPLAITGSISAQSKVYDGTTAATILTRTLSGVISGDTVMYTGGTANFADKNVGTGKTVTATVLSLTGMDAGNYTVNSSATATADITQRPLAVSAAGINKIYDGTNVATVALSDNRVGSDVFTDTYAAATFVDKNVGTGKAVAVNGITISGGDAGNYSLSNTTAPTSANITARALTVTATGVSRVYDSTPVATVTLSDNRVSGDAFTDSYASAMFADKNVGNGKAVNVSGISISGTDSGNYTFNTTAGTTASITPAPLTITAVTNTKIYDSATSAAATPTSGSLQGTDSVTGLVEVYDNKNAGTGKTLTVSAYTVSDGNGGANYSVSTVANQTGVINKAPLTITAVTNTKVYDSKTSAAATPTVSGLKAPDTVAGLAEIYDTKNVGTGKTLSVSAYAVNDGNSGGNYAVTTLTNATAVITKAALTVSATGISKTFDGTAIAAVALSDNRFAGDAFTDTYTGAIFANPNVGFAIPVSVSGISIGGTDAPNYAFNYSASTAANIVAAATATGLTSSLTGSTTPATVTLTATVSNRQNPAIPSGTVQFTDTSTSTVLAGTITYTAGPGMLQATLTASFAAGSHTVSASYIPDSLNNFVATASATTNPAATITGPASGFVQAVNTNIPFAATFTDSSTSSPSAQWAVKSADATVINNGTVSGGNISGSFPFSAAGVYGMTLTFNDGLGGIAISTAVSSPGAPAGLPAYIVVYDPSAGFVTGGGWINSNPGSYVPNTALTGKASFGFVSKYEKGANVPTGETQFTFQVANLDFHSTVYQWLVVSGPMAQYKGSGTINGSGNYMFLLTARDGSLAGGNAPDGFRLKIMDSAGTTVIYDNMLGVTDDMTSNNTQALGGGSVVIHSK